MTEVDLIALIECCYAAAVDFDLWPSVLAQVAAAVNAHGSALVPQDEQRVGELVASESLAEANAEYRDGWWRQDPWRPAAQLLPLQNGIVLRDSDLITPESKRSNPFFQEFCRRHRLGDFAAGLFVDQRDESSYSVSIFRDSRQGLNTATDLERLRALTPHVARAFTLSATLNEARDHVLGLIAGLDRLNFGTIVLDGLGRARNINATAERFFQCYLRLDGDRRVHARFFADKDRLECLIAAALPGSSSLGSPRMLLRPFGEGQPILIEIVPLRFTEPALLLTGMRRGGALLLMHDLFAPANSEIEVLLMQLGLSPAEARVAQVVGRGHSPRVAASILRISEGTARVHLRSCFAKLGITRQSELAVMVTRIETLTCRSVDE